MKLPEKLEIGMQVKVLPSYQDGEWIRSTIGEVVGHVLNTDYSTPRIDNIIRFEDGTELPFFSHEVEEF